MGLTKIKHHKAICLKLSAKLTQSSYYATTALIMPLLLIQALWVRLTTLKLPEPLGKRSGSCGKGRELKLLIIGDSAAAGVGVNSQNDGLACQLATKLATKHKVNWNLIANTGNTSVDVINELRSLPEQSLDYVLVSVGVNDVTYLTRTNNWITNLNTIVELLNTKFGSPKVLLTGVPPIHLFTAIPNPLRWWLGLRAKRLNELMIGIVKGNEVSSVLSFDLPFQPEFLAEDGMHPSKLAYQAWADKAADAIGYPQY
jgi:lysophospholipase L1-like esterase